MIICRVPPHVTPVSKNTRSSNPHVYRFTCDKIAYNKGGRGKRRRLQQQRRELKGTYYKLAVFRELLLSREGEIALVLPSIARLAPPRVPACHTPRGVAAGRGGASRESEPGSVPKGGERKETHG